MRLQQFQLLDGRTLTYVEEADSPAMVEAILEAVTEGA